MQYKHILVPTDFSKPSVAAAARAAVIRESADAKLTVIHTVDYLPPPYAIPEVPSEASSKTAIAERARVQLDQWIEENGLGDCERILTTGSPRAEIARVATQSGVDLIVMGTHGMRGWARIVGSTTNAVMHDADCDVLAVRAGA